MSNISQLEFAEVTVVPVATAGPCNSPCHTIFPFLILLFFMTFIVAITQMPLLMIVLRCLKQINNFNWKSVFHYHLGSSKWHKWGSCAFSVTWKAFKTFGEMFPVYQKNSTYLIQYSNFEFQFPSRSVNEEERSFALGMQFVIFRLFGYIPAPILFGNLIDSTCLFWKSTCGETGGRCLLYDIEQFRYK